MTNKLHKLMNTGKSKEKGITSKDVSSKQVAKGIKVEKEHIKDPVVAKKITLDHLAEIPDYYTRLKKMEDSAKTASYYELGYNSILKLLGID